MIFSGLWRSCMEVPLNATCFAVVGALVKSSCFVQVFRLDLYLQSAQVFFPRNTYWESVILLATPTHHLWISLLGYNILMQSVSDLDTMYVCCSVCP